MFLFWLWGKCLILSGNHYLAHTEHFLRVHDLAEMRYTLHYVSSQHSFEWFCRVLLFVKRRVRIHSIHGREYFDPFWAERERGQSMQCERLLSLASGAVRVRSDFPRLCCQNTAPIAGFCSGAVAQAVLEGAIAIVTKKMDFALNSCVNTSKLWHFIVFMYDGASCWNSFELYMLSTAKLKCSFSCLLISTRDLYLLCLQIPLSILLQEKGRGEWAPCA